MDQGEYNKQTEQAKEWLRNMQSGVTGDIDYAPLVTYFFVNKGLDMSPGKIGVQTARSGQVMLMGELEYSDTLLTTSLGELWELPFMRGNKSITLRAKESQMWSLIDGKLSEQIKELSVLHNVPIRVYPVFDIGVTEVESNSLTVIAMTPVKHSIIRPVTKKFQLLK